MSQVYQAEGIAYTRKSAHRKNKKKIKAKVTVPNTIGGSMAPKWSGEIFK